VLAVLASAAVAGVTPPKGDPAAIAFYSNQANAFADLPGTRIVETGFFFVRPGAGTKVSYVWGSKPAGYRPATATVDMLTRGGRIVSYLAVLRAPKVRRVTVLMAGSSVFTSTTRCWRKSTAAGSPWGTGDRYVFNDGGATFAPLVRHGRSTTISFTYPWVPGATATETNVFTSVRPAAVHVSVRVRGSLKLTIRKTITPLKRAPSLPVAPAPAIPRPKPICK
jgi:hypothetical protein